MNACTQLACGAALLLAADGLLARTQDPPATRPPVRASSAAPPPSLHATWLREVLDLDTQGAAADYVRIAADPAASALDRQLATARAYELSRVGVPVAPLPTLATIPADLRPHFPSGQPLPFLDTVLAAAHGDGTELRELLRRDRSGLPQLRPLVLLILRQNRPDGARAVQLLLWIRAFEIARAELDGRTDDARRLRALAFPDWQPKPWPGDQAAAWTQVQQNLAQWLQERELTPPVRALLLRLRSALEAAAHDGPQAALRLLDCMPLYAERLRAGIDR